MFCVRDSNGQLLYIEFEADRALRVCYAEKINRRNNYEQAKSGSAF
jgi:hypothetical protein